ncbi:MAG: TonB-dependent receptor [Alphaproteobacteria bacterium]|nr:TonB-dependent receptor [Alphaproteobacteria bacterium]
MSGVCVVALTAIPAAAQDSSQTPAAAQAPMETVVVTGILESLQNSLNIKRDSSGIVDAITAEDIGKFPDVNLADAMMRIPGITVTRGRGTMSGGTGGTSTNGQATEITVRGFGPTFNQTLFDGRQVATGTGDRAFDFSSVSSDFVSQIDVLKTPDASMSSGAIGATINVKFPKPFDHPGLVVAGSLSGTVSPEAGQFTPNGDLLFSDTFAHDTFGILVAASYSDTKTRQNHINVQGWEGKYAATQNSSGVISPTYGSYPMAAGGQVLTPAQALTQPTWFIQDYGIYHELENVEREQARVVLQWRPTDNIEITVNDNFSRDNDHQAQYGYSVWFNNGSLQNVQLDKNGTIVNFVQNSTPTDFQGAYNPNSLQYNDYGANVKWQVNDNLGMTFDFDHSDGWGNPSHQTTADMDVGYGNAADNTSIGIAVPNGHQLPYPTGFGPNNNKAQFINNGIIGSHVLPLTMAYNLDAVNQAKVEGDWNEDNLDLKFGFQYVGEHKNETSWDSFENNNWQAYSGYGPASGNTQGVTLPQNFFTKSFSTAGFINGWTGSSNLPAAILQYDPWQTENYLNGLNGVGANNCCAPNGSGDAGRPFSGTYQVAFNPGSYHVLEEKTYSGFVQATIKASVAHMPLRINVGTRYDITQENLAGLGRVVSGFTQQTGDATAWNVVYGNGGAITPISAKNSYQYLLPNLDMTLSVTDNLDLRFDASRTLTRPAISNLNPVLNVGASRVGDVTESGGNPNLLPFLSDNVDVGAQWYYAANSYLSVDTFLKSVDNFIITQSNGADFGNVGTECTNPTTKAALPACITVDVPYTISQPVNGPAANVYGIELAWQHVFGETGFGYSVNGTIVGTNKPYNPLDLSVSGFSVTGLADSANFMVFYDKDGFQARLAANWQDSYLDHFGQIQNGSTFGTEPTFVNTSWNMDFSTSYDITQQVSVYFEAMNLTDATYSTHGRYSNQLLDVVDYGRKFLAGVHFKL